MLLIILGYFLLPSLAEGANKAFTCSPGRLTATCDAGKVILIKQVRRGSYRGAFNGSHCKYQTDDITEKSDGNSKQVWKDCNLQSSCSVPFILSVIPNYWYYQEMDYECVFKSNIDMLDICDTSNGTRLVSKHGYIHSPCYPNLLSWRDSTYLYCQCSGTFQPPSVNAEDLTISVFHAFQETEALDIRWHAITNPPQNIRTDSPNFKTEQRNTRSFYLTFSSSYRGSDWNRGFWLEFEANSALELTCSNRIFTPPTCHTPTTSPTIKTTKKTTTTTTTTTVATTTSTTANSPTPDSTTTGGLPVVKSTIPGTATSNSSPTNATTRVDDGSQPGHQDTTAIAVGIIIPLIVIAAIVATVLIILRKRRQAAKAKSESNEELAHNGSAMVDKASFVNPSFDPESGEQIADPEEETDTVEDDPLSLYSLANDVVVQLEVGSPNDRADEDVLILSNNPYSAYDIVPIKPRPSVKPKPAPRKGSQKDDASPSDSEKGGNLVGAVTAEVATGPASSSTKLAEEDTALEKQGSKTGPPKPMPKPKPAAKPKLGSKSTTRQAEVEGDTPTDVYAEVEKKGRGLGKVGLGMQAPAGEDSEAEVVYAICGAGAGEREAEVEDEPGDDLDTEVNKSVKRKDRSEEGISENQNGDVYAQVDKTAKPPKPQKPKVPQRNIGGVQEASKRVDDASSGDVYAQVQKGKKTASPRGEASKCEHVNLDTNRTPGRTQDPGGKYSGFTDLYSSVDDVVTETLDDKGEEYSDGELYGPLDNNGELYGLIDDDDDGELYGQVHDAGGYDNANADMAEGRGYDGANPGYGEVGDIQNGGLTDSDDDTYDHAVTIANKFTGRQFGGGPPAPFELRDDTYDHVVLESAESPKIQSDTEV